MYQRQHRAVAVASQVLDAMRKIYILFLFAVSSFNAIAANEKRPDDLSVYSPYFFNILKLIEWPTPITDSFNLCVVGEPFLIPHIETYAETNQIKQVAVKAIRKEYQDSLADCHALFIGSLVRGDAAPLIEKVDKHPVMLFGHREHFLEQGGMVNFYIVEEKLRFEIDLATIERSGLSAGDVLTSLSKSLAGKPLPAKGQTIAEE